MKKNWLCLLLCMMTLIGHAAELPFKNATLSADGKVLDAGQTKIANVDKLRAFLQQNPQIERIEMPLARLSERAARQLFEDYPSIDFGLSFRFINGDVSTRKEAYSTFNRLSDKRYPSDKFAVLSACTRLKALDLGHNHIDNIDFLSSLKELRILILAQCRIDDLSALGDLEHLAYLELFNNKITDLTPLAKLKKLEHLNLCYNPFTDITPLLKLTNLKRLWLSKEYLSAEQIQALEAALPNCKIHYEWRDCTGGGWRSEGNYYKTLMRILKSGIYEPFSDEGV